ncbi:HK97 gp10 family phage protein [Mesorhizobium sp. VK22B]|uniref:HK97 gp10 family phage protein n=1 Tax=Mesorhizobium captivum TaxID=3072319 RepID=A0ABU4Z9D7_9HYPH|nr:HK97 gp10 family phage protein [Mesorhizobium sp. VK22B]MDX8495887.1 HK97 gp10 family phage protein [Mesorhizobium sp. VK22B]
MAIKTKIIGREALQRRLEELVPEAATAAADAKLEVAQELASRIASRAPVETGDYKGSIRGGRLADNPGILPMGGRQSKDPEATAVYADFIWRFLEFGTAPHAIRGKNGKNLVLTGADGGLVSVPSVAHPGSRAHPHVFYTWKAFRKAAKAKISRAISKAVKASNKK